MDASAPRKHRSLQERLGVYERTRELRSAGRTYPGISAELGITVDEVSYWLRAAPPRVERHLPDLTPGPELVHLVGAYLGDGRTAGEQDKKVRFKVADREFADLLNQLVAGVLRTQSKPVTTERGFLCVRYDSAPLYDFSNPWRRCCPSSTRIQRHLFAASSMQKDMLLQLSRMQLEG